MPGIPAYSVKVHAKFPDERPAICGVLCLHDVASGVLLAVMDSTHLTAVRTGLAGALGADVLARSDAQSVAVVGAGVQGEQQLRALAMLRRPRSVRVVYDLVAEVSAAVIRSALFVCDDRALAVDMGAIGGVGLAFQDVVAAWQVYRAAQAAGVGREVDFLG